ncbi:Wzz/FepE/Etk N-terminal domain-containing protein [Sunxiuqinia elliptica]|uniref:LPS O-antigen chain length determinant protein, WzzB/FepE family n=1 Tax=Sunxiuqinia elliptica TaxID=655355 RepID=A0A1I2LQH9_9BACT|nr:Wzz/FepE/Etk N-terminal domain-containing protein [Sunxiuqinia elliptica]SFF80689.1 LPS O-antigen chain length determinant protein, WzzB/FepE family [Sunxiuqinia elliptica]
MTTNQEQQAIKTSSSQEEEIDLIALSKELWDGRKTIIKWVLGGILIGLVIALLSPKEFTVTSTMVPQSAQSRTGNMSGLSSLAAMAGVNLSAGSGGESLSPMVYPKIVQSAPFLLELMDTPFQMEEANQPFSLYTYYTEYKKPGVLGAIKKYTIGLPEVILKAIRKSEEATVTGNANSLLRLSPEQYEVAKALQQKVNVNINDKEGTIVLSVSLHDPILTAQVANKAQQMLQRYITTYRIQKAQEQLGFVQARYEEKKAEFMGIQDKLALFRDRNKNVSSAIAQTEEQRLQSEYNMAFSVYSELAKQLEQAQIKVKEDTPVLTIIEPVQVPLEKSSPNRPMILIIWTFLGGIIGVSTIFGKQFLATVQERWRETDKPEELQTKS